MNNLKYKLVNHPEIAIQSGLSGILRTVDNENRDYQDYLAWVAEGNTPDPAD